jgi:mono/diheme cytochrome c family protein
MKLNLRTMGRLKTCVLFFFVAIALIGYWQRAAAGQRRGTSSTERARTLYAQNCARCHGADGRAQTDLGQLYDATDLTSAKWWRDQHINDRRLNASITNGKKGGMPAFGKKLTRADIAALVAYVRTFKQ